MAFITFPTKIFLTSTMFKEKIQFGDLQQHAKNI